MLKIFLKRTLIHLYRKQWIRAIVRTFWTSVKPNKWVFVVGCYNSGTTLLANLLALHPKISGLPVEGVAFTSHLKKPEDFGWTYMWHKCKDEISLPPVRDPKKAKEIMKDWRPWFSKSATIFLEKSVSNMLRMGWLEANFNPTWFVAIVRNGYAVAEGIRRHARPGNYNNPYYKKQYPIELCAEQWRQAAYILRQEVNKRTNLKIIRYEDLVANPVEMLQNIWNWLGLENFEINFDPIQNIISANDFRVRVVNQNKKSISNLSHDDIEKISPIIEKEMIALGYEPEEIWTYRE